MEINCLVGIQYLDQRVEYIYVNWDGHIDGVGWVLHQHYQQREKVRELIQAGSRQGLQGPDDITDFDKHKPAKVVKDHIEFFEITHPTYPIKYYYLFTMDSTWIVNDRFKTEALFLRFR